ncbi:hypothetical protein KRP22_011282 [Phytophthora ramorum]|nr:Cilia- and flagella-associated protein 52 [Phytophthora ramorum]
MGKVQALAFSAKDSFLTASSTRCGANLGNLKRIITCIGVSPDDKVAYCGTKTGDLVEILLDCDLTKPNCLFPPVGTHKPRYSRTTKERFRAGDGNLAVLKLGPASAASDGTKTKPIATACMEKLMGGITALSEGKHGDFYAGTNHSNMYQFQLTDDPSANGSGAHSNNAANRPASAGSNGTGLHVVLRSTCHYGSINDVVFPSSATRSPADNSHLFLTCAKTDIRIWNARRCQEILRVQVPNLVCNCIELTRDGGLVVSGWDDGKVRAFYPESGKLKFVIQDAHNESVTAIAVCTPRPSRPRPRRRLREPSGDYSPVARMAVCTRVAHYSVPTDHGGVSQGAPRPGECHPRGTGLHRLCERVFGRSCIVWNLETFVRTQAMFASTVFRRVLYHPDESQLLTCGSDRRITYFDAYDGEAIRFLEEAAEHEMLAMDIENSGSFLPRAAATGC